MAEPLPIHPLTVDDYHAMAEAGILRDGDRVELIDGQLVEKMTLGPKHIRIANVFTRLAIERTTDDVEVSIQNAVRLDGYNEPEPDVVLLNGNRDVTRVPHPEDVLLLVEIADSSLLIDKKIKLPRYAAAGIPEVWILNIPDQCLECYRRPSPSGYTVTRTFSGKDEADAEHVPELGKISVSAVLRG